MGYRAPDLAEVVRRKLNPPPEGDRHEVEKVPKDPRASRTKINR
jgi:hypothetical protein